MLKCVLFARRYSANTTVAGHMAFFTLVRRVLHDRHPERYHTSNLEMSQNQTRPLRTNGGDFGNSSSSPLALPLSEV
jgi:hypothetical protein